MTDNERVETRPEIESGDRRTWSLGRKIVFVVGLVVLLVGAVISLRWVLWRFGHATTDAAYVKADMANVAPQVAGKILAIRVTEGQRVHAGDVLLRIDPSQYDRKVAETEAALAQAKAARDRVRQQLRLASRQVPAAIRAAQAGLDTARTQVAKAEANRRHWEKQHARFQRLLDEKAIPRSKFEEVVTAWTAAVSDAEAAKAQVSLAEARLKEAQAARAKIAEARAGLAEAEKAVARAEEGVRMARLARSWCDLTAPIEGVVARVLADPGDFASPGRPVIGLYDPATRYVEARFEETKLRFLEVDKKVELTIDALPGKHFTGHVFETAPASAAEFALIPRDITAGEFTKVTQRVPVKIRIDGAEDHPEIVPGLSVEVAVAR